MNRRLKVLLVEDCRADARLVVEVFREENIHVEVEIARDGEQAMSYLNQCTGASCPDLILLDLNMPKKDGWEVLTELKASHRFRAIPVVILSTSHCEEDILKSYHLQASCFVTKPMDLERFINMIKSLDQFWFSFVRFPPKQCVQ